MKPEDLEPGYIVSSLSTILLPSRTDIASRGSQVLQHLNRGSYMSAHVLLNLFMELRKRGKFYCCLAARAQMLDSIYHMTLKLLNIAFFAYNVKSSASF